MTIQWILPAAVPAPTINASMLLSNLSVPAAANFSAFPPLFNFGNFSTYKYTPNTNFNQGSTVSASRGASVSGKNQNSSFWKTLGYCADAGLKLAKTALSRVVGFIGYCAKYVKTAISKAGLGKYESGHAKDMVSIMRRNKKFKEISTNGVNLKSLPAGCVLVYGAGVAGYSSKYGHTEITTGDGRAVSDGVTRNLHKTPTAIFMPVSA